ncbi:MAG: class B sortase [Oscillospiraceae bacterium]|nr:class B sortase [Oscillospiraceae bacterium]
MSGNQKFWSKIIPSKNDSKSEKIRKTTLIISFFIFLASILVLAWYLIAQARVKEDIRRRQHEYTAVTSVVTQMTTTAATEAVTEPPPPPPPLIVMERFETFLERNEHTAGWIRVPGTSINDVVVQNEDNSFYVDHAFDGRYQKAGAIFADYRNVVNDYNFNQSDNIILYGHNQRDGTMFGTLSRYKVKSTSRSNFQFYLNNPTFTFSNLYEEYTYKIIAAFVIEVEEHQARDGIIWDYHNYISIRRGAAPRDYASWRDNLNARTAINTGVDFNREDKFMTLSTCSNEFEPSRFVVVGRRVRDGEDPTVDTSLASINENAVEPDYNYIWSR